MRHVLLASLLLAGPALGATSAESRAGDAIASEIALGVTGGYAQSEGGGLLLSLGGCVGAYVTPDVAIELVGRLGVDPLVAYSTQSVGPGVRWFPGNSLHLDGGVRYRHFQQIGALGWGISDELRDLEADDVGPELAVGNRWQWGWFTLGVEWIGLYQPLLALDAHATFRGGRTSADPGLGHLPRELRLATLTTGVSF
jgi:hypothetical protein